MTQHFIPKTSTILYSITKGISEIYQLERELWLSEVFQKHQGLIIYSFIFIHSLISEILRVVCLLREKFTFFNSFGTTKISRSLRLSVYINVVLLINFLEQFELCFYFKYSGSYKVYNLGDKTFNTDFRSLDLP